MPDAMAAEAAFDEQIAAGVAAMNQQKAQSSASAPAPRDNGTASARKAAEMGMVETCTLEAYVMNAVRARALSENRTTFDAVDMARYRALLALAEMPGLGDRIADVSRLFGVAEQLRATS